MRIFSDPERLLGAHCYIISPPPEGTPESIFIYKTGNVFRPDLHIAFPHQLVDVMRDCTEVKKKKKKEGEKDWNGTHDSLIPRTLLHGFHALASECCLVSRLSNHSNPETFNNLEFLRRMCNSRPLSDKV
jgi:hypothetical protein